MWAHFCLAHFLHTGATHVSIRGQISHSALHFPLQSYSWVHHMIVSTPMTARPLRRRCHCPVDEFGWISWNCERLVSAEATVHRKSPRNAQSQPEVCIQLRTGYTMALLALSLNCPQSATSGDRRDIFNSSYSWLLFSLCCRTWATVHNNKAPAGTAAVISAQKNQNIALHVWHYCSVSFLEAVLNLKAV